MVTENSIVKALGVFPNIYGFTFFALSIGSVSNRAIEDAKSTRKEDENV